MYRIQQNDNTLIITKYVTKKNIILLFIKKKSLFLDFM